MIPAEMGNSLTYMSYLWCAGTAFVGACSFEMYKEINSIRKWSFSKGNWAATFFLGFLGAFMACIQLQVHGQEMNLLLYLNLGLTAPTFFGTIAKSNADDIIKS